VELISGALTLAVALLRGWFSIQTTHYGAVQDREKGESREKRSQIYTDYLATARAYNIANISPLKALSTEQAALEAVERATTPSAKLIAHRTIWLFKLDRALSRVWLCFGVIAGCRSTVPGGVGSRGF
jgi:hypothetical protein